MKKSPKLLISLLLFLIVVFGSIAYYYSQKNTDEKSYYAVFLDNNQVYFGHLDKVSRSDIILSDIFYLQLNSQDQLQKDASNNSATLIKLGQELHGPEDQMTINREHVMFYEKLKEDATVVNKIVEYKAGKK